MSSKIDPWGTPMYMFCRFLEWHNFYVSILTTHTVPPNTIVCKPYSYRKRQQWGLICLLSHILILLNLPYFISIKYVFSFIKKDWQAADIQFLAQTVEQNPISACIHHSAAPDERK